MLGRIVSAVAVVSLSAAMLAQSGCTCPSASGCSTKTVAKSPCGTSPCGNQITLNTPDMPPNPVPGECYAKVFIPPETRTVTERVCIREASERLEVVPAEYELVEEKVLVKQASTELQVEPAEYVTKERRIQVGDSATKWHKENGALCDTKDGKTVGDVFCLVKTPAEFRTIETQTLQKPACVKQVTIPAEYDMVRVQRLKNPATTRRITIPAEYDEIEKTIVCNPGRMEWQAVVCERNATTAKVNEIKRALIARGYTPGPLNGRFDGRGVTALKKFQAKQGLNTDGLLTYATMNKLGVPVR